MNLVWSIGTYVKEFTPELALAPQNWKKLLKTEKFF